MPEISAFGAIGPAWSHMTRLLFKPFRFDTWLILGVLCFFTTCGGMGLQSGCNVPNVPSGDWGGHKSEQSGEQGEVKGIAFEEPDLDKGGHDESPAEMVAEGKRWMRDHMGLVIGLGIGTLLLIIGLTLFTQWLGAGGVMCYLDSLAKSRAEIERPWRELAELRGSFFRWRLAWAAVVWLGLIALFTPAGVWAYERARTNRFPDFEHAIVNPVLWTWFGAVLLFVFAVAIIDICFYDFVAPLQYVRRTSTGPAVVAARQVILSHPGTFILYLVAKVLTSIVMALAVTAAGFLTCCCGFVIMIIPVIGQAAMQPVWVFHRCFSLYYLQQFGPGFDLFQAGAPPEASPPVT